MLQDGYSRWHPACRRQMYEVRLRGSHMLRHVSHLSVTESQKKPYSHPGLQVIATHWISPLSIQRSNPITAVDVKLCTSQVPNSRHTYMAYTNESTRVLFLRRFVRHSLVTGSKIIDSRNEFVYGICPLAFVLSCIFFLAVVTLIISAPLQPMPR